MFNKKIIFCTLLLFIFMVAGCEKAPERVETQNTQEEIKLSSAQYVSLEEAANQIRELEEKN